MENSGKKPQKKKIPLLCCFCMNNERRKKRSHNPQNVSATGKKTNISMHSNIKVKDLSVEENSNKIKIEKNKKIENEKYCSSFTKDDYKNGGKNLKVNINNKNNNIKKSNNILKFNTINNRIYNKNIIGFDGNVNTSNINNSNKNIRKNNTSFYYFFFNKSDLSKNINNSNKEIIFNSNKIKENTFLDKKSDNIYSNNIDLNDNNYKTNNFKVSLSSIDRNEKISNFNEQENDDNVNIYDEDNSSLNKLTNQIKMKETDYFISTNELKTSKIPNIVFKHKNINSIEYSKNKTDSIIFNNDDDNDFGINLDLDKLNKNSSISKPYNKFKLNLSSNIMKETRKKQQNFYTTINQMKENKNILNIIHNSDIVTEFPNIPKKIGYSHSLKSIKNNQIDVPYPIIQMNNKTERFLIPNFEKNSKFNLNYKQLKNINKEENNIDKEKTINLNYQNISTNKTTEQKIINEPLTKIENELNYINAGNYFCNFEKKEILNTVNQQNQDLIFKDNINILFTNSPIKNNSNYKQKITIENNNNNVNNKENEKIKKVEEDINIKEFEGEIEDEKDDLDEENKHINDSKSIISNFVITPLEGIKDMQSFTPSLFSKCEFKDNISNINDVISNNDGTFSIPLEINDTEIEISNENGNQFKSFIETPRASGTYIKRFSHKNIINHNIAFRNKIKYSIGGNMKHIYNKINIKTDEIQKINEKIIAIDEKIKNYEECCKKYQIWIEKEEKENEDLMNMINFLNS